MRAPWLLLPCIATARMPSSIEWSTSLSAPCLVRVNTSTCCQRWWPISQASSLRLSLAVHRMDALDDHRRSSCGGVDFDRLRPVEQLVGERLDLARRTSRRKQVLPPLGQQREDALDVGNEAHVEHAVGFVEHEDLDAREVDVALADVVEQAAGRGDEDIDAAREAAPSAG